MDLVPSPERLGAAAANVWDAVFKGGLADLRRTSASIIDEAPKRTIYRYHARDDRPPAALPVLLVGPPAAPTSSFDLRRGCSMVEHLLAGGHPTYVLDYGHSALSDKDLGLEHWVGDVVPSAIRRVSEDSGGRPVQVVGWCLGGIMSLLAAAADPALPVNSIAMVASPFDFRQVRIMSPVDRGAQLTSFITKPIGVIAHLDDRDWLAHVEAVDHFLAEMRDYPGLAMPQLYHRFFRVNELAGGALRLSDRTIDLASVRLPVMSIAGNSDTLASRAAVHAVGGLLPHTRQIRLETAPGGHLGVLTGRHAQRTTWAFLDDFLAEHAAPAARRHRHLRVVA